MAKKGTGDEGKSSIGDAEAPAASPKARRKAIAGVNQLDLDAESTLPTSAVVKPKSKGPDDDIFKARDKLIQILGIHQGIPTYTSSQANSLRQSEIVGVGVGFRFSQKTYTHEKVLKVYVTDKLRESDIHSEQVIPKTVDGFRTDVEEMSAGRPHAAAAAYPIPVKCGVACGNERGSEIGTIGAMVLLNNGNLCILSNNHIFANATGDLAPPNAEIGDRVFQPGNAGASLIGKLDDYVPYQSNGPNFADAAVALTTFDAVDPEHMTYVVNPVPIDPTQAQMVGMNVMKDGMMTGASIGTIVGYGHINVPVDYAGYGRVYFNDVIVIQSFGPAPFSMPGDSGSLIVTLDTKQPVALLIGGAMGPNGPVTYANPIGYVMEALNIARFISSPNDLSP